MGFDLGALGNHRRSRVDLVRDQLQGTMKTSDKVHIWIMYKVVQQGVGRVLCRLQEWRAWWRGNVFRCSALEGESNYNIGINANLTVSCNCQDRDGSGVIGDLKTHTFEQIWDGPKAAEFRASMARGKLPLSWCSNCCDRKEVRRG